MNYWYIKALGLSNDNISLAYDVISKILRRRAVWGGWKAVTLLLEHITNWFALCV